MFENGAVQSFLEMVTRLAARYCLLVANGDEMVALLCLFRIGVIIVLRNYAPYFNNVKVICTVSKC